MAKTAIAALARYTVHYVKSRSWPVARTIETSRLTLEPLRVGHADEMCSFLADRRLYEFIGGEPKTAAELRQTYGRQVLGRSLDGASGWLNWIVRLKTTGLVIGTVQTTLRDTDGAMMAQIAWIIGSPHQGCGYAKEAAAGMLDWLRKRRVHKFAANIRQNNGASAAVARHLGLRAPDRQIDGETVWVSWRRCP